MASSRQVLAEIEEEAIHVWREWPRYLVLRMRQKQAVAAIGQQEAEEEPAAVLDSGSLWETGDEDVASLPGEGATQEQDEDT